MHTHTRKSFLDTCRCVYDGKKGDDHTQKSAKKMLANNEHFDNFVLRSENITVKPLVKT